jgi:DNA-binding NarL/FixJ family response regulator
LFNESFLKCKQATPFRWFSSRESPEAIRTLPDKAAQVIRLSIKDYTNDEIAKALSISVNTVKDHKKVAYRKLRKFLGFLSQVQGFLAV